MTPPYSCDAGKSQPGICHISEYVMLVLPTPLHFARTNVSNTTHLVQAGSERQIFHIYYPDLLHPAVLAGKCAPLTSCLLSSSLAGMCVCVSINVTFHNQLVTFWYRTAGRYLCAQQHYTSLQIMKNSLSASHKMALCYHGGVMHFTIISGQHWPLHLTD